MNSTALNQCKSTPLPKCSTLHISQQKQGWHVNYLARFQPDTTNGLNVEALRKSYEQHENQQQLEVRRRHLQQIADALSTLPAGVSQALATATTQLQLDDIYCTFEHAATLKTLSFAPTVILSDLLQTSTDFEQTLLEIQRRHAPKLEITPFKDILYQHLAWQLSVQIGLRQTLRDWLEQHGVIRINQGNTASKVPSKYQKWLGHSTPLAQLTNVQILNLLQGQNQQWLLITISLPATEEAQVIEQLIQHISLRALAPTAQTWLKQTLAHIWTTKLVPSLLHQLLKQRKQQGLSQCLTNQMQQLTSLFLQAPLGKKPVLGIIPGLRSGIKVAVIDAKGHLQHHTTLFPHTPQHAWEKSKRTLLNIIQMAHIQYIALGHGSGLKETDKFLCECIQENPEHQLHKIKVIDFNLGPHLEGTHLAPTDDQNMLHAAAVARRVQDPLMELVSYPATVFNTQPALLELRTKQFEQAFKNMVSDCVTQVPLDLNQATAAALQYVPGLSNTLAHHIIAYREQHGQFTCLADLQKIPQMTAMAYEQAAAFLHLNNSLQPFDNVEIPPSAFPWLQKVLGQTEATATWIQQACTQAKPATRQEAAYLKSLQQPLADNRGHLQLPNFNNKIKKIKDVTKGMMVEGVITNIVSFGLFVNIGIHEQALIHVSDLPSDFNRDTKQLNVGDVIKAKVIQVNVERKRINLSLYLPTQPASAVTPKAKHAPKKQPKKTAFDKNHAMASAFADAFAKASN